MSDLDDPRVLFAAERTLLAWSRTATGLMAFGFFIDRTGSLGMAETGKPHLLTWLGIGIVLLGVVLCGLSVLHYRRAVASLRPVEVPDRYWVHFSTYATIAMAIIGIAVAALLFSLSK